MAGVDGNGQSELIDALTGLRKVNDGRVLIAGKEVTTESAHDHYDAGLGHIPEDRHLRGLVLDFTLAENLVLHDFEKQPYARLGWLRPGRMIAAARRLLKSSTSAAATADSGGGALRRKPAEGRRCAGGRRDPRVLIAAQPTRGLDVGAIEFVHRRLVEERDEGRAVLLISL